MINQQTIEIIKSTAPVLELHGETITKVFYKNLFEQHPSLKDIFNMTHQTKGTQQKTLANTIFQYAIHIDKLEMLSETVKNIAQKHTSLSISKEAYPIVGENLLIAIKEVLKEAATPEIMNAWKKAYMQLAAIFIDTEENIYTQKETTPGGYRGTKEFVIVKKIKENDIITSFYLKRKDGNVIPNFIAGQYIALTVEIPNTSHKHTRNYSLSDSNNKDYLRLSIKKEIGSPNGVVSNYLHSNTNVGDVLNIGIPSGNFNLKETENPIVLISGGIGITPILSMFKHACKNKKREIIFIQCFSNSSTQAFKNEINSNGKAKIVTLYSSPLPEDKINIDYDYKGYLNNDILKNINIPENSEFYFCGPSPFMNNIIKILNKNNVSPEKINYEFFGPTDSLKTL